ncbi:MAG: PAS domain-containing protein [Candidatus Marinimicrobia bacterium]|nr:PAS domain-containing protein [Candidatus Neomarinimicrobiota bacterium]
MTPPISRAQYYQIKTLSIEDGLSQNTVQTILQDGYGFMWFGTQDGLNRYDGYNFKIYRNIQDNDHSVSDNFITCMHESEKGDIWVGTNAGGLNLFDLHTENFTHFQKNPLDTASITDDNILEIEEFNEDSLLVATGNNDLLFLEKKTHHFKKCLSLANYFQLAGTDFIQALTVTQNKRIFIGSSGKGIIEIIKNPKGNYKIFNHLDHIPFGHITEIAEIDENQLLIGTTDKGVLLWNIATNNVKHFLNSSDINSISGNEINLIFKDKSSNIWIGTDNNGLNKYDPKKQAFIRFSYLTPISNRLSSNQIMSVYQDKSGLIWIGTRDVGVSKFNPNKFLFQHFKAIENDTNSLGSNTIRSLYSRDPDVLWIGTFGAGLDKFLRKENRFVHFKSDSKNINSINSTYISALLIDSRDILWAGTWGMGLNQMTADEKFSHYRHDHNNTNSICNDNIQSIIEDTGSNLWIGTENGLSFYHRNSSLFKNFYHHRNDSNTISDNRIQSGCLKFDPYGYFWVGTWKGLNRIKLSDSGNSVDSVLRLYAAGSDKPGLSDNRILSIHIDSTEKTQNKMILWVGTYTGGLNRLEIVNPVKFKPDTIIYTAYISKDGLPNDIIYGILEDDKDNLWMSTNNGLCKFSKKSMDNIEIQNFNVSDGLQSQQFFWGSYHKNTRGEMFFGGINGFNVFFPDSININSYIPQIAITNISKNNVPLNFDKALQEVDTVRLNHQDFSISFEFASLDYTSPKNNEYAYMMEGFSNQWIFCGNKHDVTYTNLNPGSYTFKVKGSNNDGVWNHRPKEVVVIVTPPYWSTWWFRITTIMLFFILIFSFYKYRLTEMHDRNLILQNEIKERKKAEKKLIRAQNYIENILNSMPSVLIGVDSRGSISHWNQRAVRRTGLKTKEAVGKSIDILLKQYPNEIETIKKSIKNNQQVHLKVSRHENDRTIYEEITVYPLIASDSKGAVVRIDDTTEKTYMEELIVQSEKMLSVGGLAAGMAHEINNPLAGMMQNAAVLLNRLTKNSPKNLQLASEIGLDFDKLKDFMEKRHVIKQLELIYDSGKRASDIVHNMLSFSKKTESKQTPADIIKIMEDSIELIASDFNLENNYDFKKIKINKNFSENISLINCEVTKIQQVFINILKNGAEAMFMDKTLSNPTFNISIRNENRSVRIEIENNGPIIPEQVRRRIFEPFFTTKEVGKGTGIGLSVSYFIITKNHNGAMWVESNAQIKTKFVILLPINHSLDQHEK